MTPDEESNLLNRRARCVFRQMSEQIVSGQNRTFENKTKERNATRNIVRK